MVRAERSLVNIQTGETVQLGDSGLTGTVEEIRENRDVVVRIGDELRDTNVRHVAIPAERIQHLPDGRHVASLEPQQLRDLQANRPESEHPDRRVIPIAQEQLSVDRRTTEAGGLVIEKAVEQHEQTIDEPTLREDVKVRRVAVNREIDAPASIREEGDSVVVPLMEEVLVVEKKLMLREELWITRQRSETHEPQTHMLRREAAKINRIQDEQT